MSRLHRTVSDVGLIGGGQVPLPGEVSLAHHSMLFLDELPECRRHALEGLRQPLENAIVMITRTSKAIKFQDTPHWQSPYILAGALAKIQGKAVPAHL